MARRLLRVKSKTQPAFGTRTDSGSPIIVTYTSDVVITNQTCRTGTGGIEGGSDHAIQVVGCNNVTITNIDFDGPPSGIYLLSCTGTLQISGCRYKNFVGPHANLVALDQCTFTAGHIFNNKGKGGKTEDVILAYMSGGSDTAHPLIIENNHFEGVDWDSTSGSGITVGDQGGDCCLIQYNTVLSPGQVGINVGGGSNHTVRNNIIYGAQRTSSNVGLAAWNQGGPATTPGSIHIANNRVYWLNASGTQNSWYNGGNMGTIDDSEGPNTFADTSIDPAKLAVTV